MSHEQQSAQCTHSTYNEHLHAIVWLHFDTSLTRDPDFVCQCNRNQTLISSACFPYECPFRITSCWSSTNFSRLEQNLTKLMMHCNYIMPNCWYYWYMYCHTYYIRIRLMHTQPLGLRESKPTRKWELSYPGIKYDQNPSKCGNVVWLCHNFNDITSWKCKARKHKNYGNI